MRVIPVLWAVLSLLGAALLPTALVAQDQDADPCDQPGACRFLEEWVYEDPEGETVSLPIGYELPWVVQGNVLLTPGETVVVRLEEVGGELVPQLVRAGDEAADGSLEEGELSFMLSRISKGRIDLTVLSQFPEPLEYAALKVNPQIGPDRTSVCTLLPGVTVFEIWQEPIYQLALWSFRPTEGYSCSIIDLEGEPDAIDQDDSETASKDKAGDE